MRNMYHRQTLGMNNLTELRIILVGKTGNGKSSTGNSLLRKSAFEHKTSPNAVTEYCKMRKGTDISNTIQYTVLDTPGLFDTSRPLSERALEIQKSVEMCKKPHAFLLVFSATNRMTEEERYTIDMLRIIFGEGVFKHSIVIFTNGKRFQTDAEFKSFWTANEHFVDLIERCGNRVTKMENRTDFDLYNTNEDAERIIKMVKELSNEGKSVYFYNYLKTHREVIMEHAENHSGVGNIHAEVHEIVEELGKKLDRIFWKNVVYGGAIMGATAVGGLGVGYFAGSAAVNAVAATSLGATVMSNAARIGTVVLNNGATVGGTVVKTAWTVATRLRFW